MASATTSSLISWAAAEVRLDQSFRTSYPCTHFVAQQLKLCLSEGRVHTTPSLIAAVREFMGDRLLSMQMIRVILAQFVAVLDCVSAGISLDTSKREWVASFLEALHRHLPEWELDEPACKPAIVLELSQDMEEA